MRAMAKRTRKSKAAVKSKPAPKSKRELSSKAKSKANPEAATAKTPAADPKAAEGAHHATAPYYRVLVDLTDTRLRLPQERNQLISGMAVTAELKVGQRSVMSYFLYPLLRGLDESIREY